MSACRVYIGACPSGYSDRAVAVVKASILANTDAEVEFAVCGDGTGSTGFSKVRYNPPWDEGFAIYLDSDVIVYGDIQELWDARKEGKWIGTYSRQKQTDELVEGCMPGVTDCSILGSVDTLIDLKAQGLYECGFGEEWNMVDRIGEGTKLLHLSRQKRQPWNPKARCDRHIDKLWLEYDERV